VRKPQEIECPWGFPSLPVRWRWATVRPLERHQPCLIGVDRGDYNNTAADWARRYQSTLVWPIRPKRARGDGPDLSGFLCVDSRRTHPFSKEYDYALGALIADVLSPLLMAIAELFENAGDNQEQNIVLIPATDLKAIDRQVAALKSAPVEKIRDQLS
jgi:hypothetical protein